LKNSRIFARAARKATMAEIAERTLASALFAFRRLRFRFSCANLGNALRSSDRSETVRGFMSPHNKKRIAFHDSFLSQ
jgi:hypothetical protein